MDGYYLHSARQKPRFSILHFLCGLLLLVSLFFAIRGIGGEEKKVLPASTKTLVTLEQEVREIIAKKPGTWSVLFVDYGKNERFSINEQVIHTAASVNKLYVLASLYYLAEKKEINLDETITLQAKDIQDFGTGTMRYDTAGKVYSLKTVARLLGEQSDNTAEYILKTKIGEDKIQALIEQFGMTQTSYANNKTSLADAERLFRKIKNNEIASSGHTAEMIDFLEETAYEDRLPLLLPKEVKVHHKIGNEVGNIHDVGLIVNEDSTYFLGVLTTDIGDTEEDTKKTIAEISKKVFDFENQGR